MAKKRVDETGRIPDTAVQTMNVLRGMVAAQQCLWRALFFQAAAEAGVPPPKMTGDIASFEHPSQADAFAAWARTRLGVKATRWEMKEGQVPDSRHCVSFSMWGG